MQMEAIIRFAAAAAIPLGLLNLLVLIVAGIWLAVLGRWGVIGWGIVALLVPGVVALAFSYRPGLLLYPSAALHDRERRARSRVLRMLSEAYRVVVLSVWCLAVLWFFSRQAGGATAAPVLLWSYGIAAGSIVWMDQNELQGGGGRNIAVSTLFAQAGYVLAVLAMLGFGASLQGGALLFGAAMATGLLVQWFIAWLTPVTAVDTAHSAPSETHSTRRTAP
jgi:hypothetical protein